jgi:AAHS family 4-hydroxybenzoate transporter-like MFS transporter
MTEFLPHRARGAFTTLAFLGITVGGILPGLIASRGHGSEWRLLLGIGGAIPLIVLPVLIFALPESIRFLLVRDASSPRLHKVMERIAPGAVFPTNTVFILDEAPTRRLPIQELFRGPLAFGTPCVWLCFAIIMLVNFFVSSWLATVLSALGYSPEKAAATASLYYVGGVFGGLTIGFLIDRIGPVCLAVSGLIAAAAMAGMSVPGIGPVVLRGLVLCVGFGVLGTQLGLSAVAGMLYPTTVRAKGVGAAHAIGRIGAISGPIIAGALLGRGLHGTELFIVPVPVLLVMAGCLVAISWQWRHLVACNHADATPGLLSPVIDL